jgi:hypothetical protein
MKKFTAIAIICLGIHSLISISQQAKAAILCQYNENPILLLPGQTAPLQCDANGNLKLNITGEGSGDTITSPNSTLTVSGTTINTELDINLTNPNTWSGLQTFNTITVNGEITAQDMPGVGISDTQAYMRYSEAGGLNTNTWLNAPLDFDLTNLSNYVKRGITMNVRTVPTVVTISIASPGVVTWANHGLAANAEVQFYTTGALPTGLATGTNYYVVGSSITTNTFEISTTPSGSAVNTTGSQTGTQSAIGLINTGGIAISLYTPPDNGGDTSGIWINQEGGGNALSVFNLCGSTPAGYVPYCANGHAIEATVDGTKNAVVVSVNDGVAYIANVTGTAGGAGFYAYPADDTDYTTNRAFRVSNAENSAEEFFVTMAGEGFFNQEVLTRELLLQGNISSAAWGSAGLQFQGAAATLTDTSSSGTVATNFDYVMTAPTLVASSPTTYNDADTVVITGPPVAGMNVTIGTARALKVSSGTTLLQGGAIITGGTVNLDPSNFNVLISPTGTGTVTINPATMGTMNNMAAGGSPPTPTGTCPINTQVGGNTTGSFQANGACAAGTVILTFSATAPHGWYCEANDLTTMADAMKQSAYSTTSCTFTGTMASADLVTFNARAF